MRSLWTESGIALADDAELDVTMGIVHGGDVLPVRLEDDEDFEEGDKAEDEEDDEFEDEEDLDDDLDDEFEDDEDFEDDDFDDDDDDEDEDEEEEEEDDDEDF